MIHFDKVQQRLLLIMAAIIIVLSGVLLYREMQFRRSTSGIHMLQSNEATLASTPAAGLAEPERVPLFTVYITGQVRNPGIIQLPEGARVADAVEMAGGALSEADLNRINLAVRIKDEGMYYVPQKGEDLPSEGVLTDTTDPSRDGKIDINTATQSELESLNGIGPARALRIIEYRERQGAFKTIEELMNVSGIGEKIFDGLKEQVIIR